MSREGRMVPSAHTVQQIPIENTVINLVVAFHDLGEQLSQEIIIGSFFETKFADIVQIDTKFFWVAFTEFSNMRGLLLFSDLLVLLLVCCSFQALPRQAATEKVHEDMAKRFQVIPSRLFPS
jgi:hypothetical protein